MDWPLYIAGGRRRFRTAGGPEEWGTPMPLLHESITTIGESALVARVLRDVHYRDTLLNIKGMQAKTARILQQVQLRDFRKDLPGDVDILVIPPDEPEVSTAIQVKRFKAIVSRNEDGSDHSMVGDPRRFHELMAKGIQQANYTKRLGFAQVYLWVFVVIDTREKNNGWYTYEGPDSLLRSRISQAISPAGLEPAVGLMEFEWVQPMDRPPLQLSTHGGHLRRLAEATPQAQDVSAWMRSLLQTN